jgi:hypothetical protein
MDLKITETTNEVIHDDPKMNPVVANEGKRSEPGRLFYCFLVMLMLL